MKCLTDTPEGVRIRVRVIPRASATRIDSLYGDALKVRVQSPPVDGKANKALVKWLAKVLSVSASQLTLVSGETSRDKVLFAKGVSSDHVQERIRENLAL